MILYNMYVYTVYTYNYISMYMWLYLSNTSAHLVWPFLCSIGIVGHHRSIGWNSCCRLGVARSLAWTAASTLPTPHVATVVGVLLEIFGCVKFSSLDVVWTCMNGDVNSISLDSWLTLRTSPWVNVPVHLLTSPVLH